MNSRRVYIKNIDYGKKKLKFYLVFLMKRPKILLDLNIHEFKISGEIDNFLLLKNIKKAKKVFCLQVCRQLKL